jgi:hypothetical protein
MIFMKSHLVPIVVLISLSSCSTVKYYNKTFTKQIPENQLKADVDFVYTKLQKLHPNLYWYISKKDLDYKFDSVKASITRPMTSREFYMKISPVVAAVREGHAIVYPPIRMLRRKGNETRAKYGATPLSKFEFEVFDNKLYIIKNNSTDTTIAIGTEVLSVNGTKPMDLLARYKNNFASDGYNQTFKINRLSEGFPIFYYFEHDITDTIRCKLKFSDSIRTISLERIPPGFPVGKGLSVKVSRADKENKRKEAEKDKYLGYDKLTKRYSKNLSFYEADSSIALMKLNNFSRGQSKKFFHDSFEKLSRLGTKALIIDLRDNPGGKIREINELYSYLVDSDYYFIDKSVVTSKTSILHLGYFNGIPWGVKIVRGIFYPLYVGIMAIPFAKVRKGEDGKYYYSYSFSKLQHPKSDNFKGNVYVLINGGSFSASCLISSDLKGSKRAVFIGSETGGGYNGTVAGILPAYTLPHSKLRIRFGLALIRPHYKTDIKGRGIFPDVEVAPTLQDRLKGNDPELNMALEEARRVK